MAQIESIEVVEYVSDNEKIVLVTLTNGLFEKFDVTTDGSTETWTTLDGTFSTTFDQLSGSLDQLRELAQELVTQITDDAIQVLVDSGMPGNMRELSSDAVAKAMVELNIDERLGIPPGSKIPTPDELARDLEEQLTGEKRVSPADEAAEAAVIEAAKAKAAADAAVEKAAEALIAAEEAAIAAEVAQELADELIYEEAYATGLSEGMSEEEAEAFALGVVAAQHADDGDNDTQ